MLPLASAHSYILFYNFTLCMLPHPNQLHVLYMYIFLLVQCTFMYMTDDVLYISVFSISHSFLQAAASPAVPL